MLLRVKAKYNWDKTNKVFRDSASGRVVPARKIRYALDAVVDEVKRQMSDTTDKMIAGKISQVDWRLAMAAKIKQIHLINAAAANGGVDQMSSQSLGQLGAVLRKEYRYFDGFGQEVEDGTLSLAQVKARVAQYAEAGRATFERINRHQKQIGGYTQERNVLHPVKTHHCRECVGLSQLGWVAIKTLPHVGTRQCRSNDRCTIEYRKTAK